MLTSDQIEALNQIQQIASNVQALVQSINVTIQRHKLDVRCINLPAVGFLRMDVCNVLFEHESECHKAELGARVAMGGIDA